MNFIKKLFGSKEKTTLTEEELEEAILAKKINSIFPYFKQINAVEDSSQSANLTSSKSITDNSKDLSVPEIKLVNKNICADLNCLYVFDTDLGLNIIQESDIEELKITQDGLHKIAMANFRQLISKKLNAQSNGELFWFVLDGNLEAGLVLVDEIWDQVESQLNDQIVICVPARDVLIATSKNNEQGIADFTEKAKDILLNGFYPLSKNWFIRENGTWHVFRKII